MALWFPGPWDDDDEPAAQPESPHQAAIARDAEPKKPRRKRAPKTQTTSD